MFPSPRFLWTKTEGKYQTHDVCCRSVRDLIMTTLYLSIQVNNLQLRHQYQWSYYHATLSPLSNSCSTHADTSHFLAVSALHRFSRRSPSHQRSSQSKINFLGKIFVQPFSFLFLFLVHKICIKNITVPFQKHSVYSSVHVKKYIISVRAIFSLTVIRLTI